MAWLNLDYDEGPFYQTQRFDRYKAAIQQLLDQCDAYYCSCSKERLEKLRETQMADKQKPRYDGCCREKGLKPGDADNLVVRFRNPQTGEVSFDDQVKGRITVSNTELDDLVIARGDGSPTYNLSVVVDDMDMQISHVVRGDDHVNNTPRQINIFRALGASVPLFAHVPMILGDDGKRLSKRHGAVGVMQYFEEGYLPEAMLNYLVRLGWSHGDQEIFSVEEMIEHFELSDINRAPSVFNTEKLRWINQQYLMTLPLAQIVGLVVNRLDKLGIDRETDSGLNTIVDLYRQRVTTVNELVDSIMYCFEDFDDYDEKAAKKTLKAAAIEPLQLMLKYLTELDDWGPESIHGVVERVTRELDVNMGKVGQPLRVAVTGGSFSPPIDQTVAMIGKARTLSRITRAIETIVAK